MREKRASVLITSRTDAHTGRSINKPMKRTVDAYAKINLYLDIVNRRENGYHDIRGVMHKISLADSVSVEINEARESRITLTCSAPSIPTDEGNIAYRAAQMYLDLFTRDHYDVAIHIDKHIPAAGGLAGGSTDAAAVLSVMHDMIGGCTREQLIDESVRLGADVPFCLSERTMITEGIGEVLTPCPSLTSCTVLICNTGESVSTPQAYARLDDMYDRFREARFDQVRFSSLLSGLDEGDLDKVCGGMFNIFESAVLDDRPLAKAAKDTMTEHGAIGAMMSGSGPTVFGIYKDTAAAEEAYGILVALGYDAHLCSPIG